jgi:hypothetical protein
LNELGVRIIAPVETNMVFIDPTPLGFDLAELQERALEGVANSAPIRLGGGSRLVLHIQTAEQTVDDLIALVRHLKEEKLASGFKEERDDEWYALGHIHASGSWTPTDKKLQPTILRKQQVKSY